MSWVLILTMWSADSKFIWTVPGFTTEARCMAAAKVWTDQNSVGNGGYHKNTAVCAVL